MPQESSCLQVKVPQRDMSQVQLAYSVAASPGHDLDGHYECARRIPAILEALQEANLTADAQPEKVVSNLFPPFQQST